MVGAHDFTKQPLFYYLAYQGVHAPAEVPQSYVAAYAPTIADTKRRTFAGMLSCVDEGIANVRHLYAPRFAPFNHIYYYYGVVSDHRCVLP